MAIWRGGFSVKLVVELVVWGFVVFGGDMFGLFLSSFVLVARNSPGTCLPICFNHEKTKQELW